VLHYQPVVMTSHTGSGWWARKRLVRWQNPKLGLAAPGHVHSPLAEKSGLIVDLGQWGD